ncbi:Avirulence (Avh) protein [Phytophthora megakarya]|uniref:RxLR effector protein n=1 Tax=Phytophthora megakarya TaxID=4795 RepID=A0A225WMD1_9STRA|nr:Avirulence (Avh) protein [Phytophthora megakarya]
MRCAFYVAIAVAVLARGSVITAFANTDEANLLSKATPDFATDAVISQKRFLRVADPKGSALMPDDEERAPKIKLLSDIVEKLDKAKEASKQAVQSVQKAPKNAVKGVQKATEFTKDELAAAAGLLKLKKTK